MNSEQSEIEIQAVNLAQQWYNLNTTERPEISALLPQYLKCFPNESDKKVFLIESLRIAKELVESPKKQIDQSESYTIFCDILQEQLHPDTSS